MATGTLRIGDKVVAERCPYPVEVVEIERLSSPGDSDGRKVAEIEWEMVPGYAVVVLANHSWRHGDQIRPATPDEIAEAEAIRESA